ncbi:MAG: bifunctional DNA-formamidopyrimidine glycosylase/DNA-(apurinic or apyrimidinic site) lyase [Parvularculaceae bacterium]
MPELPEVETVRRGLAPVLEGATIRSVRLARRDLRIPFPPRFEKRLTGAAVSSLLRRGKFLIANLSTGESLLMHLGMTGRFTLTDGAARGTGDFYYAAPPDPAHDHVAFGLDRRGRRYSLVYNDVRRFGLMDLAPTAALNDCPHLAGMGPEPLSAEFGPAHLGQSLKGRSAPIKTALLDQRIVAGLGNIYVCEALYRAGVSPCRKAGAVRGAAIRRLCGAIIAVLEEGIAAGGSTLRDFAGADGTIGGFQERFNVYDREGAPCEACRNPVRRIIQSGRSTFFCSVCQR